MHRALLLMDNSCILPMDSFLSFDVAASIRLPRIPLPICIVPLHSNLSLVLLHLRVVLVLARTSVKSEGDDLSYLRPSRALSWSNGLVHNSRNVDGCGTVHQASKSTKEAMRGCSKHRCDLSYKLTRLFQLKQ